MNAVRAMDPERSGHFVRLSSLGPARQEKLLELVDPLLHDLKSAAVDLVHGSQAADRGIPASVLGHAVAHLHRHRDVGSFRAFVAQLDALDELTAPNQLNPRAHHRALRQVLEPWLREHDELEAHELLFVLAWVRRLLPEKQGANGGGSSGPGKKQPSHPSNPSNRQQSRRPVVEEKPRTAKPPASKLGNPLADKLAGLEAQLEKKEGS